MIAKHGAKKAEEMDDEEDDIQLHQDFKNSTMIIDYSADSLIEATAGKDDGKDGDGADSKD